MYYTNDLKETKLRLWAWRRSLLISSFEKRSLVPSHIKQVIITRSFFGMVSCVLDDFLVVSFSALIGTLDE